MESVYLETTFISYLVARPSRDVIVAGHQQTTQEWWANRRTEFECSVSQVVIDEASALCANIGETTTSSFITVEGEEVQDV